MKAKQWLFTALILLASCGVDDHADNGDGNIIEVGDHLPVFTVTLDDGSLFSSERLEGETVIVLFHTDCQDCQRELPKLNTYYLRRRAEAGFRMIAIAREETSEDIAVFWKEKSLSIPYSPQSDRLIYNLFATHTIPRVYLCSKEGIVKWMGIEKFDMPE